MKKKLLRIMSIVIVLSGIVFATVKYVEHENLKNEVVALKASTEKIETQKKEKADNRNASILENLNKKREEQNLTKEVSKVKEEKEKLEKQLEELSNK